jgi:hypothetical protein
MAMKTEQQQDVDYRDKPFDWFQFAGIVLCIAMISAIAISLFTDAETAKSNTHCSKTVDFIAYNLNDDNEHHIHFLAKNTDICSLASTLRGWKRDFKKGANVTLDSFMSVRLQNLHDFFEEKYSN